MFFQRKPKVIRTIRDLLAAKGIRSSAVAVMSSASIDSNLARFAEDAVAEGRTRGLLTTSESGTIFEILGTGRKFVAVIDASSSSIAGPMIVIQSVYEVDSGTAEDFARQLHEAYG